MIVLHIAPRFSPSFGTLFITKFPGLDRSFSFEFETVLGAVDFVRMDEIVPSQFLRRQRGGGAQGLGAGMAEGAQIRAAQHYVVEMEGVLRPDGMRNLGFQDCLGSGY